MTDYRRRLMARRLNGPAPLAHTETAAPDEVPPIPDEHGAHGAPIGHPTAAPDEMAAPAPADERRGETAAPAPVLITPADIARRHGVTRQAVTYWQTRESFPAPTIDAGKVKLWTASDVDAWRRAWKGGGHGMS